MSVKLFLSYAREDEERVGNLYDMLEKEGLNPWMDKRDILGGENWEHSIWRALQDSDFFVLCLSENSVDKRGFLRREIKRAKEEWEGKLQDDIYFIPLRLDECDPPNQIKDHFHWIDIFEEGGFDSLIQSIEVGAKRRDLEWTRKPERTRGNAKMIQANHLEERDEAILSALDLYHFLQWQVRCLRATPTEFERLFEEVAERLDSERFMRVRAYGSIGDRKMDGAFWAEGTVFQVYSPDEMKQSELTSKIEEDLKGAREELGEMLEEWIFVYNTRRGAPPDVPVDLSHYQDEYPELEIRSMSEYGLWEKVRDEMSIQDRAEILGGPPSGWEEYFDGNGNGKDKGRVVILHGTQRPVDEQAALTALEPERPYGPPLRIQYPEELGWQEAATKQEEEIRQLLDNVRSDLARFAVFAQSHIPLLIHLGFLLTDRVDVRLFQYHRDTRSWNWGDAPEVESCPIETTGVPENKVEGEVDVTVRVSLSAQVSPHDTREVAESDVEIDLEVAEPNVLWLHRPDQLTELRRAFRQVLKDIRYSVPDCRRIHLFYAGPAPGAVALGQSINPTMNPPVVTYEYNRNRTPRYEEALILSGL